MYKERIQNLLNAIDRKNEGQPGARDFVFNAIENALKNFVEYTNKVYNMETQIMLARHRIDDPREYQDLVTRLDTGRRAAHEGAIASVSMLNRICDMSGVEKVYDGPDDRVAIGDFCGAIVNEFFEDRSRGRVIEEKEVEKAFDQEVEGIDREK
jgi:hypothetical protein